MAHGIAWAFHRVHENFALRGLQVSLERYRFVIDASLEKPCSASHLFITGD
jgi:hypothetical protein